MVGRNCEIQSTLLDCAMNKSFEKTMVRILYVKGSSDFQQKGKVERFSYHNVSAT